MSFSIKRDVIERRPGTSLFILGLGIVVYGFACRPAITRRGYPEIDPFWLAMPWLWVVPIILSGIFDAGARLRRSSIAAYCVLVSFFLSGVGILVMIVPHHVTFSDMLIGMMFWCIPIILFGFGIERAGQAALGLIRTFSPSPPAYPRAFPSRVFIAGLLIAGAAVAFPFVVHVMSFASARRDAIADAEKDWAGGKAIWYVDPAEPPAFGAEDDTYDASNGLKTQSLHGGVIDLVYKKAYLSAIEAKLAKDGPAKLAKNLFTRNELANLLSGGRLKRVASFPLRHGRAEILANGDFRSAGESESRGDASPYVYAATVPEKDNALVEVTDSDILVFDREGSLLQRVSSRMEPTLFSGPPAASGDQ